jgi:perosamine synthetase
MFEDEETNINSWSIPTRAINLPSYHEMSQSDISFVSGCISKKLIINKSG